MLRKIVAGVMFLVLMSGCATATRVVTSPAALVSCPVKAVVDESSPGKKAMLIVGAPFIAVGSLISGLIMGPVQDVKDLVDGNPTNLKEAAAPLNCYR